MKNFELIRLFVLIMFDTNKFYSEGLIDLNNLLNDNLDYKSISINDIYNYLSFFKFKISSEHSIFLESLLGTYKKDSEEYSQILKRLDVEYEKNAKNCAKSIFDSDYNHSLFSSFKTDTKMNSYIKNIFKNEILEMKKFHFNTFNNIESNLKCEEIECITQEDLDFFTN